MNKNALIEIILGIILIIIGIFLNTRAKQTAWIAVYPPPWQKTALDLSPYALWVTGGFLLVDGVRKIRR